MLSLERQERYRQRCAEMRAGWRPASHVYRDLVDASLHADARVLDLGCGRGGVVEQLETGAELTVGLDPDIRSLREHRAPQLVLACGLAEELPYEDRVFDLVCCSWVLEHLRRPFLVFRDVARVLGPGGQFVFLTPNIRHPLVRLNRALRWTGGEVVDRVYGRDEPDIFPAFYRANSAARLRRMAREIGFEGLSIQCVGDPSYLAFNEALFRLASLLERVTPRSMRVHLVGVCAVA